MKTIFHKFPLTTAAAVYNLIALVLFLSPSDWTLLHIFFIGPILSAAFYPNLYNFSPASAKFLAPLVVGSVAILTLFLILDVLRNLLIGEGQRLFSPKWLFIILGLIILLIIFALFGFI